MKHFFRLCIVSILIITSTNAVQQIPQTEQTLIMIPVSTGELFDKITILEIKMRRITDPEKNAHVCKEWELLTAIVQKHIVMTPELEQLKQELLQQNEKQWDVEDGKRAKEAKKEFDAEFIELARNIYVMNDYRNTLKRKINELTGSAIIEEKQYHIY